MAPLLPGPLPADFPLAAVGADARACAPLGVWLFGVRRAVSIVAVRVRRRSPLLIDGDLGRLLLRCPAIAVRLGAAAAVVPAEELTRVRVLRIVPSRNDRLALAALHGLFPSATASARGVEIVLGQHSAEELLAACACARVPIVRSQVVYGALPAAAAR